MLVSTHLVDPPLHDFAIGVRLLQPNIIVCVIMRFIITLLVLPREHVADDKHQERADEVADADHSPGYVVPA